MPRSVSWRSQPRIPCNRSLIAYALPKLYTASRIGSCLELGIKNGSVSLKALSINWLKKFISSGHVQNSGLHVPYTHESHIVIQIGENISTFNHPEFVRMARRIRILCGAEGRSKVWWIAGRPWRKVSALSLSAYGQVGRLLKKSCAINGAFGRRIIRIKRSYLEHLAELTVTSCDEIMHINRAPGNTDVPDIARREVCARSSAAWNVLLVLGRVESSGIQGMVSSMKSG